MPKERLHLLLLDECLKVLEAPGKPLLDGRMKEAAYLGSILPDVFFYGPPPFKLSALGKAVHRLEGDAALELSLRWLEIEGKNLASEDYAWVLGLTCHFLADGLFHPYINRAARLPCPPCRDLNLPERSCHHLLESELEAQWLARLGPRDKYLPLLKRLGSERQTFGKMIGGFRRFLSEGGIEPVPTEETIMQCLFWQTFMLRQFARTGLNRWRSRLLARRFTQPLGALMVPDRKSPLTPLGAEHHELEGIDYLFSARFMTEAVTSLSTRLRGLAARF